MENKFKVYLILLFFSLVSKKILIIFNSYMVIIVHQAVFVGVGCFEAIISVLDNEVGF